MQTLYSPLGRVFGGVIGVAALISLANVVRLVVELLH